MRDRTYLKAGFQQLSLKWRSTPCPESRLFSRAPARLPSSVSALAENYASVELGIEKDLRVEFRCIPGPKTQTWDTCQLRSVRFIPFAMLAWVAVWQHAMLG